MVQIEAVQAVMIIQYQFDVVHFDSILFPVLSESSPSTNTDIVHDNIIIFQKGMNAILVFD